MPVVVADVVAVDDPVDVRVEVADVDNEEVADVVALEVAEDDSVVVAVDDAVEDAVDVTVVDGVVTSQFIRRPLLKSRMASASFVTSALQSATESK